MRWDPDVYARYADERGRPFLDLVARISATSPRRVVDLGCGTGALTARLAERWPAARVEGIDSSPDMIAAAARLDVAVSFRVEDIEAWTMPADADVVVCNAALQWVPAHRNLLRSWAVAVPPGGWLAFQVPGNFDSPSHALMRSLAMTARWAAVLAGVLHHHEPVASPAEYASVLLEAGLAVDVWETTYLHVLSGPDPALEWLRGTGLRPILTALGEPDAQEFTAALAARLRVAYPASAYGTVFPFRRLFAVAHRH